MYPVLNPRPRAIPGDAEKRRDAAVYGKVMVMPVLNFLSSRMYFTAKVPENPCLETLSDTLRSSASMNEPTHMARAGRAVVEM